MFDIDFALCVFIYVCTAFISVSWCVTINAKISLLKLDKQIKNILIEKIKNTTKTKKIIEEIYNILKSE